MKKCLSFIFLFFVLISFLATDVNARPVLPEPDGPTIPGEVLPNGPVKVASPIQNAFVLWRPFMPDYNCYGYAIGVQEWIAPGYSFNNPWNASNTLTQLRNKVMTDLVNLGYANVRTVNASYQPASNEYMIAFRLGYVVDFIDSDGNTSGYADYHFMRYDQATNQWRHKPGGTSVLRLISNQSITQTWLFEQYRVYSDASLTGWYRDDYSSYGGSIVFIAYRNSLPTDPIQVM